MSSRDRSRDRSVGKARGGGGGGGGTVEPPAALTHGSSASITGSGFGTRNVIDEIIDRGTASSPNDLWTNSDGDVGTDAFSYSTGFHSVAMPHTNITKYAVAQIQNDNGGAAVLDKSFDWGGGNKFIYVSAYRRVDPDWTFGASCNAEPSPDDDNNFKYLVVTAGSSPFGGLNWYHDQTHQKCELVADWGDSFYSSGELGTMDVQPSSSGGENAQTEDPFYNWVKFEYVIFLHSSAGAIWYALNNTVKANLANQNNDNAAGNSRSVAIGTYARQRDGEGHYIYIADLVMLATTGSDVCKRVMLTNSATYSAATITEYCEVVNWADGNIDFVINKGALSAGQVWAHAINGVTVLATKSLTIE